MSRDLRNFRRNQTIQKSFHFKVIFNHSDFNIGPVRVQSKNPNFNNVYNVTKELEPHHVESITLPISYDFQKEIHRAGSLPRTFPILNTDGNELTITFIEDARGTISNLIHWLQKRIINDDGLYNFPSEAKIESILITLYDNGGNPIVIYNIKNAFFLRADPLNLSYTTNEYIRTNVIFNFDEFSVDYKDPRYQKFNVS